MAMTLLDRRRFLPASSTASRAGMRAAASAAGSSEPMKTRFICARRGSALGVGTARVIWFADAANAPAVLIFRDGRWQGHGSLPFRNDGGLGFPHPNPQGVGVADGRTNETNGNGRGRRLKFV